MPFSLLKLSKLQVIALCLLVIGSTVVIAATKFKWWTPPPNVPQQIQREAVIKESPIETFVPSGLLLTLTNAIVVRDKNENDKSEASTVIQVQITAGGTAKLTSYNLMLLEYSPSGKLSYVNGWLRNDELPVGKPVKLSLEVDRRITSVNRLVLAVERVNNVLMTVSTDFAELAQAAMSNKPVLDLPLSRSETPLSDDFGAEICSNAFRRAMSFTQAQEKKGDSIGISTISCNQEERSFVFGYSDKKPK